LFFLIKVFSICILYYGIDKLSAISQILHQSNLWIKGDTDLDQTVDDFM